ncbi:MAG: hypothetical protein FWD25_08685 [Clostridia bacterium]|nr:hypothetical protein [Clostridia bacterium]
MMLPLVLGGLFLLLRYDRNRDEVQTKNMCLQGMLAGSVFMMKFPNTILWAGLLLPPVVYMLARGRWKKLITECGAVIGGFALVTLPFIAYLLIMGALADCIDICFRYNMLYTSAGMTFSEHARHALLKALDFARSYWRYTAVILFGFLFLLLRRPRRLLPFAGTALGFLLLGGVIFWGFVYPYAAIPMMAFSVFALTAFFSLIPKTWVQKLPSKGRIPLLTVCMLLLGALIVRQNALVRSELFWPGREPLETCQQQVAALLRAEDGEEPTLLQVDRQDAGFYTAAGILPQERYFTTLNSTYAVFPQVLDAQLASIQAGKNEFILLTWALPEVLAYKPEEERTIYDKLLYATEELYERVATIEGTALQSGIPFTLYRLRNEL